MNSYLQLFDGYTIAIIWKFIYSLTFAKETHKMQANNSNFILSDPMKINFIKWLFQKTYNIYLSYFSSPRERQKNAWLY